MNTGGWGEMKPTADWPDSDDDTPENSAKKPLLHGGASGDSYTGIAAPVAIPQTRLGWHETDEGEHIRTNSGQVFGAIPIGTGAYGDVHRSTSPTDKVVIKLLKKPIPMREITYNQAYQQMAAVGDSFLQKIYTNPVAPNSAVALLFADRGTSLDALSKREPPFKGFNKKTLAWKTIQAVFNFHKEYRMIHGDIKPPNVTIEVPEVGSPQGHVIDIEGAVLPGYIPGFVTDSYQPFDPILQNTQYVDRYALALTLTIFFDDDFKTFEKRKNFFDFIYSVEIKIMINESPIAKAVYALITDLDNKNSLADYYNLLYDDAAVIDCSGFYYSSAPLTESVVQFYNREYELPTAEARFNEVGRKLIQFVRDFHKRFRRPLDCLHAKNVFIGLTYERAILNVYGTDKDMNPGDLRLDYRNDWYAVAIILCLFFNNAEYQVFTSGSGADKARVKSRLKQVMNRLHENPDPDGALLDQAKVILQPAHAPSSSSWCCIIS